ncbi:death domain-containing protein CRADD-like [Mercenaria mercenaria]|uniref:death domain-containing protein CRADD-like n=1 Tax=Mercenaria mercenaria TaxID=6596 RepID=UPI00234EED6D|nr:death domain-containing protein CRADD-like [Mercenaria mercenaria]
MEHGEREPASGFEVNRIVVYKPIYIYCNTHPEVTAELVDAFRQCDINEHSDNPDLSVDTLQRKPTDKDLCTIALNIGPEYLPLALQLGLVKTELYHIEEDNRGSCVRRNIAMLFRWRENREDSATFEELRNACIRINVNPGNILKNIEA